MDLICCNSGYFTTGPVQGPGHAYSRCKLKHCDESCFRKIKKASLVTQALETYQCPNWPTNKSDCPTNDHPTVAALHVLTERALELPSATKEQGGYVFWSYVCHLLKLLRI